MDDHMKQLRREAAAMSRECDRLMAQFDRHWPRGLTDKFLKQYTGLGMARYNREQLAWRVRVLAGFADAAMMLNRRALPRSERTTRVVQEAMAGFRTDFPMKPATPGKKSVS